MEQVINTAAANVQTPRQAWDAFVQPVHAAMTELACDGTHRGARHGAFTQCITVATAAIEKLQPGFYPVRLLSKEHGVQGWAFRVAAKRMLREYLETGKGRKMEVVVSGQKGDATVLHILADGEKAEAALVHGETVLA